MVQLKPKNCHFCKRETEFRLQSPLLLGFATWVCQRCGAAFLDKEDKLKEGENKLDEKVLAEQRIDWCNKMLTEKKHLLGSDDIRKIKSRLQSAKAKLKELSK